MNNEDIKNLEEIINLCKEEINNNDKNITAILDLEDLKSLKNLLTRYKELEEKNKTQLEAFELGKESSRKRIEYDYIPKSKVKEKIEELKEIKQEKYERVQVFDDTTNACCYQIVKKYDYEIAQFAIKTLQELLREE